MRIMLSHGLLATFSIASAALLYEDATIIAFDESQERIRVLRDAHLLVENDRIAAVGEGTYNGSLPTNITRLNATERIISPGFIDTRKSHSVPIYDNSMLTSSDHHLWQTLFRTMAANSPISEYFQRFGADSPSIEYFTTNDTYLGQLMGCLELLYEGTTTVLDHAHGGFSDQATDAAVNGTFESGIRAYYAHTIQPTLPNSYSWEDQIAKLYSLAREPRFREPNTLVKLGLSYDSFPDASPSNISTLWNAVQSENLSVVTMHFNGGVGGPTSSPKLLDSFGWLNTSLPVVFAHGTYVDSLDASILRSTNQYVAMTPESEDGYGIGHHYARHIMDQASLGIDTHISFSASMVQQARLWLQSLRNLNYWDTLAQWESPNSNPMSVEQAFYLVTRAGGLALRRNDLGVINVGAKADLVVFRTDAPNMIGWEDPVAAVVLHSNVGDVEDVLVNGQFVKQGGKLTRPDYASLSRRFKSAASRIQNIWAGLDWPAITDCGLSPCGNPVVIDTLRGNGTGF